jgi:hypothetical protein
MDKDARHDLEAATRALEAELRARDRSRAMTQPELDGLVDCAVGLERALGRAKDSGAVKETPGIAEAFEVWDSARQFVHEHEPTRAFSPPMWTDPPMGAA